MRIALTEWQGRISPVLDTARALVVADIEDGALISRRDEAFSGDMVQEKIARLRALGVELLVCGAVSRPLAESIVSSGIRLVPFVSGDIGEVLQAVTARRMPDPAFAMPGCRCGRGRRFRARRGSCVENPNSASRSIELVEEKK